MKIGVATKDWDAVSGHAGQTRCWLIYDLANHRLGQTLPQPTRIELTKEQLFHHFKDDGPHPLDGVEIIISGSAGDGFIRHMQKRGAGPADRRNRSDGRSDPFHRRRSPARSAL